jgi:hypothetical protein
MLYAGDNTHHVWHLSDKYCRCCIISTLLVHVKRTLLHLQQLPAADVLAAVSRPYVILLTGRLLPLKQEVLSAAMHTHDCSASAYLSEVVPLFD